MSQHSLRKDRRVPFVIMSHHELMLARAQPSGRYYIAPALVYTHVRASSGWTDVMLLFLFLGMWGNGLPT